MKNMIIAALLVVCGTAAGAAQTAIKCTGATEIIGAKDKRPESRIYVLNDATKSVSTWSQESEAAVPFCVHACTTVFGAKHIRLVDEDSSGTLILDVDRTTGEVMDITRLSGSRFRSASMETFEGTCSKTALPKSATKAKF